MESLGGNSALTERHRHGTERERLETQFPERLDTLMYIFLGWNISIICITNSATSDIVNMLIGNYHQLSRCPAAQSRDWQEEDGNLK